MAVLSALQVTKRQCILALQQSFCPVSSCLMYVGKVRQSSEQQRWLCRFPATFTFVLRAFATLEGIGRALDPDYKFVAVAQPYATQLLDLQVSLPATCKSYWLGVVYSAMYNAAIMVAYELIYTETRTILQNLLQSVYLKQQVSQM